jgi:2-C-methyl-D-erythritol 4-phosphate cytidylyltransferase
MIEWSIDALRACESVRSIVVAVPPGHGDDLGKVVVVVAGGDTRAQSVANALEAVETELVAIHDAARPLLTPELFEAVVATLAADPDAAGAIAATPITDTVKSAGGSRSASTVHMTANALFVERTLDRSSLWAAQTPQVFRAAALRDALAVGTQARDAATDESMLVEAAGGRVLIHLAAAENFKVTTPHELAVAELLLQSRSSR